jgi:hypothetical protein
VWTVGSFSEASKNVLSSEGGVLRSLSECGVHCTAFGGFSDELCCRAAVRTKDTAATSGFLEKDTFLKATVLPPTGLPNWNALIDVVMLYRLSSLLDEVEVKFLQGFRRADHVVSQMTRVDKVQKSNPIFI